MANYSIDREREHLEYEINNGSYQSMLQGLREKEPFFRRLESWPEVMRFMQEGPESDQQKDNVLYPILREHSKDKDPRWRTILLVMFWPALEMLYFQKVKLDKDIEERWSNLVYAFLVTIHRFNLKNRSSRLAQKIINLTAHRLHDEYRRLSRQPEFDFIGAHEEFDDLTDGVEEKGFEAVELSDFQEAEFKRLCAHLEAGTIKKRDFILLVSTRIYEETVAEYARKTGLSYECAKRRRSRAEARIARKEKRKEKNEKNLAGSVPKVFLKGPFYK